MTPREAEELAELKRAIDKQHEDTNKKLDRFQDTLESVLRQLPNGENLQTKSDCQSHRDITRWLLTGIGAALIALAGWVLRVHLAVSDILHTK